MEPIAEAMARAQRRVADIERRLGPATTPPGNEGTSAFAAVLDGALGTASPTRGADAYGAIIEQAAASNGLSPALLRAVIEAESGNNPRAVSPTGAQGLMQLMPSTAAALGVSDPFDPEENIMGGARYLRQQLDRFGGNERLALAAYNAGPGAVLRHHGVPPFAETQAYVARVLSLAGRDE